MNENIPSCLVCGYLNKYEFGPDHQCMRTGELIKEDVNMIPPEDCPYRDTSEGDKAEIANLKAQVAVLTKELNAMLKETQNRYNKKGLGNDEYNNMFHGLIILNDLPASATAYAKEHEEMKKALEEIVTEGGYHTTKSLRFGEVVQLATEALKDVQKG